MRSSLSVAVVTQRADSNAAVLPSTAVSQFLGYFSAVGSDLFGDNSKDKEGALREAS